MKYFIDPELGRIPLITEEDDEIDAAASEQVIQAKIEATGHTDDA